MPKYKVLAEFELEGAVQAVDSVVELTEEVAVSLIEEGKLELVVEGASKAGTGEASA